MSDRARALSFVTLAYVVAAAAAYAVGAALAARTAPWLTALVADAVATVVVFAFSRILDNSSVYDPYWSVAPIAIALYAALAPWAAAGDPTRKIVVASLVALWGVRLTYNWARGFTGSSHEDWRYVDLRRKFPRAYWLVSFSGIHFFPTALTYGGSLPLLFALPSARPFGLLDTLGAALTLGSTLLEAIADQQLHTYKRRRADDASAKLDTAIWRALHYPNYIGEMGFWWGLFVCALAAGAALWTAAGALAITLLFVFISIPMKRERLARPR